MIHGGAFTGGETVDELVQLIDIEPTLLDATAIDTDELEKELQDRSFHSDAETESRKRAFAEYLGHHSPR